MSDFRTPGQFIEALLQERGWTQRTLAAVTGRGESAINKIIALKQPVDAATAIIFEEVFSVPAEQFLALQREYDLAVARVAARPDPGRAIRAQLLGGLPIADMVKRGWLGDVSARDVLAVEQALMRFFDVEEIEDIEVLPHAAKKARVNAETTPAQLAWLYRVRAVAAEMLVGGFSENALNAAIAKLRPLLSAAENVRHVPRILAEAGIRFVLVETLPSAKIDGVCFWLAPTSPVIAMTVRHDRIDNFWFVLRHELEHARLGHGKGSIALDAELEGDRAGTGPTVADEERLANEAATDFCIAQAQMDAFVERKAPLFSERDLVGFARTLGVHPGIVAGQLQCRTARYERFRQHLAKVRSFIIPTAMTDGWGDIAPVGE